MSGVAIAQVIINGLELGLIYALIALGFSLIYGVGRIIFCTHGEIYALGAMASYLLVMTLDLPFVAALVLIALSTGLFGVLIERFLFRNLYGNIFNIFIVSLALAMIISNLLSETLGAQAVGVKGLFPGNISPMGVTLSVDKLVVALTSIVLILALDFFLRWAKMGQAIRAVAQNPEAASLQGIDTRKMLSLTFFLSLALAGTAGVLVAPIYFVNAPMGSSALLNTFIVVILGGLGSFPGAIAGGLFVGILQTAGGLFVGQYTFLFSFVVVIIFLIVRPQGFFGRA